MHILYSVAVLNKAIDYKAVLIEMVNNVLLLFHTDFLLVAFLLNIHGWFCIVCCLWGLTDVF